eukprot:1410849-Prorocentrum_lima.AAC.1
MTSSLVGSEMCIRDRRRTVQHGLEPTILDQQGHAPSRLFKEPEDMEPTPVSYTHLTLPTICSV